jgi:hypothetical protein
MSQTFIFLAKTACRFLFSVTKRFVRNVINVTIFADQAAATFAFAGEVQASWNLCGALELYGGEFLHLDSECQQHTK